MVIVKPVTSNLDKASENDNLVANTTKEESYEMSPYQSSDDEEEEEDDIPTKKFIPSWASCEQHLDHTQRDSACFCSKNYLVIAVSSQQKVDPNMIFPPESFCSINEVLVSRKQQQQK
ncbi:hypothetical protein CK203_088038 [Vitis vinifera]|uniref:Uncharacterized protein n=1 Tax=Vitis vinifera TaxID=29760 RepID=A0A438ER05_VITVI|nr:hypothetical protein CK203_088038 [Vitis vinifera]